MKILYGVQGTGNGHTTRARAMAAAFRRASADVDFIFSGRTPDKYFDMDIFGDYRVFPGLTFVTRSGQVSHLATVLRSKPLRFIRDVRALDLKPYDLIITDFEPITAWAAKLAGRKVIGLGHQYAFHYPIPQHHGSPLQRAIIKYFAPATTAVGMHWHHFDHPIFPPIAPVAEQLRATRRKQIVVYLPFESTVGISRLLAPFGDYRFRVYHPEADVGEAGHISWFRPSREQFHDDLCHCEGVICNAGFELTSEALQLGRKLLVKPLVGQSEQYSNVLALDLLGYGHVMYELNGNTVGEWLASACGTRIRYPDVAAALCTWLLAGAQGDLSQLSEKLWSETELPDLTPATRTDNELVHFTADNHWQAGKRADGI